VASRLGNLGGGAAGVLAARFVFSVRRSIIRHARTRGVRWLPPSRIAGLSDRRCRHVAAAWRLVPGGHLGAAGITLVPR
jgi:hypothetical protein